MSGILLLARNRIKCFLLFGNLELLCSISTQDVLLLLTLKILTFTALNDFSLGTCENLNSLRFALV